MSSSNSTSGGIGFIGALTLIFITLKLLNKVTWSWWWVLSPVWISVIIIVLIILIALVVIIIKEALK